MVIGYSAECFFPFSIFHFFFIGGARRQTMPQVFRQTAWLSRSRTILFGERKRTTAPAAAATYVSVRIWQSTHWCSSPVNCDRWPWHWCCTHSEHAVSLASPSSWMWSDEMRSIGRYTASSNHE